MVNDWNKRTKLGVDAIIEQAQCNIDCMLNHKGQCDLPEAETKRYDAKDEHKWKVKEELEDLSKEQRKSLRADRKL